MRGDYRSARVVIVLLAAGWPFVVSAAEKTEDPARASEAGSRGLQPRMDLTGEWAMQSSFLEPGESRDVTATFAAKDAGKDEPRLEVGGWNVETDFDCTAIGVSPEEIRAGEGFTVTASVAGTFLDGSRVALRVDGKPVAYTWAWARAGRKESLGFPLTLEEPGRHEIAVGGRKIPVTVRTVN